MGVLNVTPDSFFDGGRYAAPADALERALQMIDQGVDLIDIGGESTRPGAEPVSIVEELGRTIPVIEKVASLGVPVAIDTRKSDVAKAAIDVGASIVNDVSAGTFDDKMLPLVADRGVPIVLMHMRGTPDTMDTLATYDDVVGDVLHELRARVEVARLMGVSKVWVDPGLGFAKTAEQCIALLRDVQAFRTVGCPVVVGPSRKRFIGGDPSTRLEGTLAVVAYCVMHGVDVVRVHDVLEARRVVDMIERIL